jgi:hypothetical protein
MFCFCYRRYGISVVMLRACPGGTGSAPRELVRPTSDLRNLEGLNADRVIGDLRDPASMEKAPSGCDALFHVVRTIAVGARSDEMYRSNVEGTRSLPSKRRGSKAYGVSYTSSAGTSAYLQGEERTSGEPCCERESPVALGKWDRGTHVQSSWRSA